MTVETKTARVLSRFWIVAGVVPALVTVGAVSVQLSVMPRLPGLVAINWGPDGRPDWFAPAWASPVATGLLGIAGAALILLVGLPGLRRGERGPTFRVLGALSVTLAVFVCMLLTWMLVTQVGLPDASAAREAGAALVVSFLCASIAGVVAWFAQPRQVPVSITRTTVEPLVLGGSERAAWMRETSLGTAWMIMIVTVVAMIWASTLAAWLLGAPDGLVVGLAALSVGLLILTATAIGFRVRVDQEGLAVNSVLGFPRFRIPRADIREVEAIEINPVGDFGGWGLRWAPGRFGVITSAGEAIQVHRHSGRRFVVTVGDAATAAALLQAIATRHESDLS